MPFLLNGLGFLLRAGEHVLKAFPSNGSDLRPHIWPTVRIFRMYVYHLYMAMVQHFLSNGTQIELIYQPMVANTQ